MAGKGRKHVSHRSLRADRQPSDASSVSRSDVLTSSLTRSSTSIEQQSSLTSIMSQSPPEPHPPFNQSPIANISPPRPDPADFGPVQGTTSGPYPEWYGIGGPDTIDQDGHELGEQDLGDSMVVSPRTPEFPSPSKGPTGKEIVTTASSNKDIERGPRKEKKKKQKKPKKTKKTTNHEQGQSTTAATRTTTVPPWETDARNLYLTHDVMAFGEPYNYHWPGRPSVDYLHLVGLLGQGGGQQQQFSTSYYPATLDEADLRDSGDDHDGNEPVGSEFEWDMCEDVQTLLGVRRC
ncbi:hypothetical protein VTK26DRAFT_2977 [Humicola hyalothermophila]